MITFHKTEAPCVVTPHIAWHLEHGDVWNVCDSFGKPIAVVYFTSLPGTGVVVHFDVPESADISLADLRSGFTRFAERLESVPLVLTTVDASNRSLLKLLRRLGFRILAIYTDPDGAYALLQFIPRKKPIL